MSYRRCPSCRNWSRCTGYPFYDPSEIEAQWCKLQIVWVLSHLETLQDGQYPVNPEVTGYVGGNKSGIKAGAKFLRPADLYAEMTARLNKTGEDGRTLQHEVQMLGAGLDGLSQSARNAINYCAGKDRKAAKYGVWLSMRKWRAGVMR